MNMLKECTDLANKDAVVVGGLGLIGKKISYRLAECGMNVTILDIDEKRWEDIQPEIKEKKLKIQYSKIDISDTENIEKRLLETISVKKVHVWVNSSYPRTADWDNGIEETNVSSWKKNVDMHMNSYCLSTIFAANHMKRHKIQGSIINIGSIYGVVSPDFSIYPESMTSAPAYAAIKGGIISFTRYCAAYYGKENIRVNVICPGGIEDNQNKVFIQNYEKKVPLKRMGKPEEVANVVKFLASSDSSYVTGATLMVDGGWTCI